MKLIVKNLGPIKSASIDLSKRFYTFVGYNNSGKTYLANVLWCVLQRADRSFFMKFLAENGTLLTYSNGNCVIPQEVFDKLPAAYLLYIQNEMLPKVLNLPPESIILKEISLSFEGIDTSIAHIVAVYPNKKTIVNSNANSLEIKASINEGSFFDILLITLLNLFYEGRELYFLPAERISFMTFYKYFYRIEQERREEIEQYIRKMNKNNPNWAELEEISESAYTQTAKTLLETIYDSVSYEEETENKFWVEQLEKILGGKLKTSRSEVTDETSFYFQLAQNQAKLKLHTTSSSINQLATLYFYWKYWATSEGEFLMIDEPEQNLYPENQIKLTELLIQFANQNNNRVLITTHSPIVAEVINNYLILGQLEEKKQEARKALHLAENCELTPQNTGIYFFTGENVVPYEISDYGTVFKDFKAAQEQVWNVGYQLGNYMYQQNKRKANVEVES